MGFQGLRHNVVSPTGCKMDLLLRRNVIIGNGEGENKVIN